MGFVVLLHSHLLEGDLYLKEVFFPGRGSFREMAVVYVFAASEFVTTGYGFGSVHALGRSKSK